MFFTETELKGAFVIDVNKLNDNRGFFGRTWCQEEMEAHGLNGNVVQSNTSFNIHKGTLRGMHYQKHPYEETKLVRCTKGSVYDVIVDLRPDSPTFKKWLGVQLSENDHRMIYVPEKFAHGYLTLEDNSEVTYLVTQFHKPGSEGGLRWNDPEIGITWPNKINIISEKDKNHPLFNNSLLP